MRHVIVEIHVLGLESNDPSKQNHFNDIWVTCYNMAISLGSF